LDDSATSKDITVAAGRCANTQGCLFF